MAALEREKQREERRRIELEELRVQEEQAAEDRRKAEEEARKKAEGLYTQENTPKQYLMFVSSFRGGQDAGEGTETRGGEMGDGIIWRTIWSS